MSNWKAEPFPPETVAAIRHHIRDFDGVNIVAVEEFLLNKGRTQEQIDAMDHHRLRMAFATLAPVGVVVETTTASIVSLDPSPPRPDPIAAAIGLKSQHPDWSDRQIAKVAGCDPSKLTRSKQYRRVRDVFDQANTPPPGYKTADGDIEATAD